MYENGDQNFQFYTGFHFWLLDLNIWCKMKL